MENWVVPFFPISTDNAALKFVDKFLHEYTFFPRDRMLTFYLLDIIVNEVFLGFVTFSLFIFFKIE